MFGFQDTSLNDTRIEKTGNLSYKFIYLVIGSRGVTPESRLVPRKRRLSMFELVLISVIPCLKELQDLYVRRY